MSSGCITVFMRKPSFNFKYLAFSKVNNTFRIRTYFDKKRNISLRNLP